MPGARDVEKGLFLLHFLPESKNEQANDGTRQPRPQEVKTGPVPEHAHDSCNKKIGKSHSDKDRTNHSLIDFSIIELVGCCKNSCSDEQGEQYDAEGAAQFFHGFNF